MFDFGNANDGQRKAIAAADGPVLITAGPGTGKTYTLVQRAIYLIEECNVKPESIFIDIATSNDMTPQELFSFIMKSTGATMPVRGSGKGQGKPQAAQ